MPAKICSHRVVPALALTLAALVSWSIAAVPGRAAQQQPTAAPQSPLEKLAWFVGGTWTTEEQGADGSKLTVRMNCRWADTKHAIVYEVAFESGGKLTPQYDGMFVWHPGKNKIVLWQVNRKGEVAEGEVAAAPGGGFDQTVRVNHPDGGMHFLKSHYELRNKDEFLFKAFFRLSEGAEWQDALDLVYRRQEKKPMSQTPEVEKLAAFLGEWNTANEMLPGPMGPGGKSEGHTRYYWGPGRLWLMYDSSIPMPNGMTYEVHGLVSYDAQAHQYVAFAFNSMAPAGMEYSGVWTDEHTLVFTATKLSTRNTVARVRYEFLPDGKIRFSSEEGTGESFQAYFTSLLTRQPGN